MRKVVLLLVLSLFLVPQTIFAHEIASDGPIAVAIHIEPGDDPIVGEPADIYLEILDVQKKFSPINCDCKAVIALDGREIFSTQLFEDDSEDSLNSNPTFSYSFPKKGVYSVTIQGTPKEDGNGFSKFSVNFDVRVAREIEKPAYLIIWISLVIVILGGMVALLYFRRKIK